jgi:hypothetical protein
MMLLLLFAQPVRRCSLQVTQVAEWQLIMHARSTIASSYMQMEVSSAACHHLLLLPGRNDQMDGKAMVEVEVEECMVEECIMVGLSLVACLEMVVEWAVALSNLMIQIDVWRTMQLSLSPCRINITLCHPLQYTL